ncbi:family 16 glycosylhydrolase [Roseomonas sp. OT10]|uniref:family 16 glycosylhydrolase n=1 Tax=Roseomonas cutis TaxID=2897332 RepID=UPI001E609648|nr:family 16 glycosylhydrolase [Roseomonas sp. OT10]UFN50313.1 family 16 glycosylhydrolase [Roseomonas sp. OT10]
MPVPAPELPQSSASNLSDGRYTLGGAVLTAPQDGLTLVANGSWGSGRLAAVRLSTETSVNLRNYVQSDVVTEGGDDTVLVSGAKRGSLQTGAGNDTIRVSALSNNPGAGNAFLVDAGSGNDLVAFTGHPGMTEATIRLGDGNDTLSLSGLRLGAIDAGSGDDLVSLSLDGLYSLRGGGGTDTLQLSLNAASLAFARGPDGALSITLPGRAGVEAQLLDFERVRFLDGTEASVADLLAGRLPTSPTLAAQPGSKPQAWLTGVSSAPEMVHGSDDSNDAIYAGGGDTLVGGKGDDWYYVADNQTVLERAGEGIDTITYWGGRSYTLPDNVENLTLALDKARGSTGQQIETIGGSTGLAGYGNALNNWIIGDKADNILDGRGGNDVLTGGGGADTFILGGGNGHDTVRDFTPGTDRLLLTERFDWRAAATDTPDGLLLALPSGDTVRLDGVSLAQLSDRDIAQPLDPASLRLTFQDSFDSLSLLDGSSPDGGTWRPRTAYGDGTIIHPNDVQYYVHPNWAGQGVNPFHVEDGVLTIEATYRPDLAALTNNRPYLSGVLTTEGTFAQQYGYFEARIKLPEDTGMYPAFWLLPADGSWPPELDIMEFTSSRPDELQQMELTRPLDDPTGWHTYGLEWTADRVAWYVDGVMTQVIYGHSAHTPMYTLLNLSVGTAGGVIGDMPADARPGDVVGSMQVDWVRAYESREGAAPASTVAAGAPALTVSLGNLQPGGTPAAADAFHYIADTDADMDFSVTDLGMASLSGWNNLHVGNDRSADTLTLDLGNGWAGMNLQLTDEDGGRFTLDDFLMLDVTLGGTQDSSVTLMRPQFGQVTTGSGNDVVSITEARIWDWSRGRVLEVRTGAGNDTIEGWTSGSSGGLFADGASGDDVIRGSIQADTLTGGDGSDQLTGLAGQDTFILRPGDTGADVITDFTPGEDVLRLEYISATEVTLSDTAAGALLTTPTGSVLLQGVAVSLLSPDSILYA